jgi:hypothetical protein
VVGPGGGPAMLQISTTGNAQFDSSLGLAARQLADPEPDQRNGAGSVFVNAIDVNYSVPASTSLLGTIAGVTGGGAASLGFIQPAINNHYLFNC